MVGHKREDLGGNVGLETNKLADENIVAPFFLPPRTQVLPLQWRLIRPF